MRTLSVDLLAARVTALVDSFHGIILPPAMMVVMMVRSGGGGGGGGVLAAAGLSVGPVVCLSGLGGPTGCRTCGTSATCALVAFGTSDAFW